MRIDGWTIVNTQSNKIVHITTTLYGTTYYVPAFCKRKVDISRIYRKLKLSRCKGNKQLTDEFVDKYDKQKAYLIAGE